MPNQIFHLNAKNYEKIRSLPNMSGLINTLLEGHFESISNNDPSVDSIEIGLAKMEEESLKLKSKKEQMETQAKERIHLANIEETEQLEQNEKDNQASIERAKKRAEYDKWADENPTQWKNKSFEQWAKDNL